MADAYWRVTDGRIHPVSLPPVPSKRPRTENDVPSGTEMLGSHSHNDVQGMHHAIRETDPIETSYEQYLLSGQTSSYAGGDSANTMSNGAGSHSVDGPRVMGTVGSEPVAARSRTIGFGGVRPEVPLPPEASSTVFVEGLPAHCTRREVSHIFRPFVGFKEVRLVIKESRHPGGHPFVLCFVDFMSPSNAATAMDTLQGYKLDEHDRDSPNLSCNLLAVLVPGQVVGIAESIELCIFTGDMLDYVRLTFITNDQRLCYQFIDRAKFWYDPLCRTNLNSEITCLDVMPALRLCV